MNLMTIIEKRLEKVQKHIDNGVRIIDPLSVFIDDNVELQEGVTLEPFVTIKGNSKIMANAVIGSHSVIDNCVIGENVIVKASTIISSSVGEQTTVGPYAYIRDNACIGKKCRIGDYVEVKKSIIGDGSKSSHLAYIGDAEVGERVNIGCGVIFCNYDGKNKRKVKVGNDVFIGSNSNLIAPIIIEDRAYIAAGTTVTQDIESDKFVIGRSRETIKERKS